MDWISKVSQLLCAFAVGIVVGYLIIFSQTKNDKQTEKVSVYILGCGEVKYKTEVDAMRERLALEILGLKTDWSVKE